MSFVNVACIWFTESTAGGAVGAVKQEAKQKAPKQDAETGVTRKKKRKRRNFGKHKKETKTWCEAMQEDMLKQDICDFYKWWMQSILGLQNR